MATMIILDDPAAIPADSLDGLIYLGEGSINEVKAIRKLNLPTVSLGANRVKYFSGICQKKDFIYDVFMKFLLKGRRKIALLNFGGDSHLNEVNLTHLQKAIFDFGAGEYVEITGDSGNLQCKLEECLLRDDRPDAIFLPRWAYLAGVMLTLQKLKLKIGREIGAFVGNCPDFGLSEMPAYVNSAVDLQAEQAANMLARMIKDPDFKGKVIEDEPIISNKEAL
jgi:DNA-binding LacI/PurR family transcriptional regulator